MREEAKGVCLPKDMTGGERLRCDHSVVRRPGRHMAPTADFVTLFHVMKLVINDLCIFHSNSSVAVSRFISEQRVCGKLRATCKTSFIKTSWSSILIYK